jgi:metal-responsive CopG/Arc/MetJ family transcriptional regulator
VTISIDLLRQVDEIVEHLGFGSREAFVEAAIRRLLDHYAVTLPPRQTRSKPK